MSRSSLIRRYALATAAMVLAIIARMSLQPVLGEGAVVYLTLFPVLVFVGWRAGPGPAFFSLLLGGLAAVPYVLPPTRHFTSEDPRILAGLATYLVTGGACVMLGHAVHRAHRLAEANAQRARVSEEQIASMFEVTSVGMVETDPVTRRFLRVNPAMCAITGYGEAELLGMTVDQLNHPHDRRDDRDRYERLVRGEGRYEIEKRYLRKCGTVAWVQVTRDIIRDGDGRPVRAFAVVQDVTARKKAEQRLSVEHAVSHALVHASGVDEAASGMLRAIHDGLHVNFCALWLPDEVGRTLRCFELFAGEDATALEPFMEATREAAFARGVGLPGRVWQSGLPVWIEALTDDGNFPRLPAAMAAGLRSGAAAPIQGDGVCLGVIEWFHRAPTPRDRDLLDTIEALGAEIGQFLLRRRAEDQRLESEERFRSMANTTPAMIWTADPKGTITFHNQRWLDYTGIDAADNAKDWPRLVLHPDDYERCVTAWTDALKTGRDYEVEVRNRRRDGEYRWFLTRATPIRDARGRLVAWYGSTTDIHDHMMTEQALRGAEDRLQLAMLAGDAGAWDLDLVSGRNLWSDGHFRLLGHEPTANGEASEAMWRDAVSPEDLPTVLAAWERAERERDVFRSEHRLRRADNGAVLWVRAAGRFFHDASGKAVRFVGVFFDITATRRLQDGLRASEERFRRAIDATGALIYEVDLLHDARAETYGLGRFLGEEEGGAELTSAWWHARIHPGDLPAHRAELEARLADAACDSYRTSYRVRHRDGSWRYVEDAAQIMRDARGRPTRLVGAVVDVSERKRAEETLREADRRKDEFLAMLAHELRNPLSAIRSAVALLRLKGPAKPELDWGRDVIDRQVTHLARLIDDLLDVSRITRGKVRLRRGPLDVREVVGRAVEGVRHLVEIKKHELALSLPASPLGVHADAARLEQIVGNLLANAAKYTEEGGRIALSLDREGDEAVIRVRDNGMGIPPEQLPRIFDLFAQIDVSLDRSQGGLGIGLTLVKSLAEMHGGSVSVASDGLGRGSEFTVRLPLPAERSEPSAEALGQNERAPSPTHEPASRRVLVVDDNVDAARGMADLLKLTGYDVRTAHDGPAALEVARAFRPEIALLDIGLPGMNGYEVARALRDDDRTSGAILIAASGYGRTQVQSEEAGFDHHLSKPIDFEDLRALLDLATARRGANERSGARRR